MAYRPDNLAPLTPLDTFRRVVGWNPRHFWGFAGAGKARQTSKCLGLLREYGWQDQDAAARSGIREALANAEANLAQWLGYRVAPAWAEATLPYPRLGDLRYGRAVPAGADGRRLALQLPEGHVQALGVQARATIGDVGLFSAAAPFSGASPAPPYLIYRDRDGDGIVDQVEAAIATTATDPDQIAAYVPEAHRWDGSALGERWRVRPLQVTIAGGVATLVGPAWACAQPVRWEGEDGAPLNGLDPAAIANYLDGLTICRLRTDGDGTTLDTAMAVLTWETLPAPGWACCGADGSSTDPAAVAQAVARVGVRNAALGQVTPAQAVYDPATGAWAQVTSWAALGCREPDRVTVRYRAGLPAQADGQTAEPWATTVCRLAAADLARPVCSCQEAHKGIALWQQDLSQTGATDALFAAPGDVANPLGARRGQIYAWRQVVQHQATPGISI
jgi:hypothetical protein